MGYYDDIAEGYDSLHKDEQMKKLNIIKQEIKDGKILDVGCGTGFSLDTFNAVGMDPSIKLLKKSKRFVINAVAEHLPFKDNSFDTVISVTAIQNFYDVKKGLEEIRRVGKSFALSVLKKSSRIAMIRKEIENVFDIRKVIEEEKDLIFFA